MVLVERGTHPKWTGGFVTVKKCGRCKHQEHDKGGCGHLVERQSVDPVVLLSHWCRCQTQRKSGTAQEGER